jgi:hypothetical protein
MNIKKAINRDRKKKNTKKKPGKKMYNKDEKENK